MEIVHINKEKMKLPKTNTRILKVVKKPQGKNYVNGFNLQGRYLEQYGFFLGDFVNVSFETGKIIISKNGDLRA